MIDDSSPLPFAAPRLIHGLGLIGVCFPTFPKTHQFLLRGQFETVDAQAKLSELLCLDPTLYAAVHWLRNGADRGLGERATRAEAHDLVQSLTPALARCATLGFALFRSLRMGRSQRFNYDEFWTQALARGIAARALSASVGVRCSVTAFMEAFLESVGEAVLVQSDPEHYDVLAENGALTAHELQTAYGVGIDTVTWTLLRDLGLPKAIYRRAWVKSRKARRTHAEQVGKCDVRCGGLMDLSALVGTIIAGDAESRKVLWPQLVALRNDLEMGRDELNAVCDSIVSDWWNWGDLLSLPVRTLPGFAALSDWNERSVAPKRFSPMPSPAKNQLETESGLDILYVENDPAMRESVSALLRSAEHSVRIAYSGAEALEILAQTPPQVVLASATMPAMDGLELCRHVRRTELGKRIYFMLLVDSIEGAAIQNAYSAGINDFALKQDSMEILRARVSAAHNFIAHWEMVDGDRRIIRNHCEDSRQVAARMKEDSMTDALTELPNRRYAMDRLREEWLRSKRNGQSLSVIMLDIDFFKKVNDQYGHDVGDVVLQETARVIKSVTRRNESACRIGGEEFLVICSESTLSEAASCAERVRTSLEAHRIQSGSFDSHITVSLGVAERTSEMEGIDDLFKRADEAIYVAKESGRNCVVLAPDFRRARFVGERLAG